LEGFGVRVQESVFECRLDQAALDRLTTAVWRELEGCQEAGEVRVYRVCADCLEASFGIGRSVRRADAGPLVV
jgi:CRISPR-associated endonuclease Cas2